jgi:hypothetical protein
VDYAELSVGGAEVLITRFFVGCVGQHELDPYVYPSELWRALLRPREVKKRSLANEPEFLATRRAASAAEVKFLRKCRPAERLSQAWLVPLRVVVAALDGFFTSAEASALRVVAERPRGPAASPDRMYLLLRCARSGVRAVPSSPPQPCVVPQLELSARYSLSSGELRRGTLGDQARARRLSVKCSLRAGAREHEPPCRVHPPHQPHARGRCAT